MLISIVTADTTHIMLQEVRLEAYTVNPFKKSDADFTGLLK